jgi:hypothetical protein
VSVHFVQVAIEDAPGSMGQAAELLSEAHVNIEAFVVDGAGARFLTTDPDGALAALDMGGYTAIAVEVLAVELPNKPGELARLGKALGRAGINIHSIFGIGNGHSSGRVYLRVDRPERAMRVLGELGYASS